MNPFHQNKILSYEEAEQRLNDHLNGLKIVNIQNSVSDTKFIYFTIYSRKHDSNYSLALGTNKWIWKDARGVEISVFKSEFIDYHIHPITSEVEKLLENELLIKKIELSKKLELLHIHFENGAVLEAKEDLSSEDKSYYQLMLFGSKLYLNYNLLIQNDTCIEEITNGEEHGKYKVAMFNLDYFRAEHRNFTTHAIKQARERKSPISFIQAKVLYKVLTTSLSDISNILLFSPWRLRRTSIKRTRFDTIPTKELITIARDECLKNHFTIEEAKDILKSTYDSFKEWMITEKNLDVITDQEYGTSDDFSGLIRWYEEEF